MLDFTNSNERYYYYIEQSSIERKNAMRLKAAIEANPNYDGNVYLRHSYSNSVLRAKHYLFLVKMERNSNHY